ncbi:hypothetical protein Taro_046846 [Colocasia esculenta]|uniref:Uncharacterized protein n=1 Tax=Colocasia esculenta TaxID=4460 RepID=A0A843WZP3_COLES|nr:hypothetical protein [Colocasia esculenta]
MFETHDSLLVAEDESTAKDVAGDVVEEPKDVPIVGSPSTVVESEFTLQDFDVVWLDFHEAHSGRQFEILWPLYVAVSPSFEENDE